jgi:nitrogen regulatory protein PII
MMLLTAVVTTNRIEPIWRVLRLFEVTGMTVTQVAVDGRRRSRIEVTAPDADADDIYRIMARLATPGDQVRVVHLDAVFAVSTGAAGPDAL